jgi:hypothetical protein
MLTKLIIVIVSYKFCSIVLMAIVQEHLQMHEVVYFVPYMNWSMVQSAMFMAVQLRKLLEHKHVINIMLNG